MSIERVFSGIQASGSLGIGHYLGAIRHWLAMQERFDCCFCVADLHALTVRQDPKVLQPRILSQMACYLACGLDPDKTTLFVQSHVPAHSELAWLLMCQVNMGELSRMTQYKDKAQKQQSAGVSAGLLMYPALMAADILLYQTNKVPVGEDQKQHLELARDLAGRFNHHFGQTFVVPEPIIADMGGRLMSLQDPSVKMSKSDPNQNAYLALLDPPDLIVKKLKKAVTDSHGTIEAAEDRPGITNLLTLYACLANKSIAQLEAQYAGQGYGAFKNDLADLVVSVLEPIQVRYAQWMEDPKALEDLMQKGAEKAASIANATAKRAKEAMGLYVL